MQRVLLKKKIKKKKLREREIEKRNERKTRYPAALKDALPPLNTVQPRQGPACFLPPDSPACSEEPRPAALPASLPQPRGCSRRPYGTLPPSLPPPPLRGPSGPAVGRGSGAGALRWRPRGLQRAEERGGCAALPPPSPAAFVQVGKWELVPKGRQKRGEGRPGLPQGQLLSPTATAPAPASPHRW